MWESAPPLPLLTRCARARTCSRAAAADHMLEGARARAGPGGGALQQLVLIIADGRCAGKRGSSVRPQRRQLPGCSLTASPTPRASRPPPRAGVTRRARCAPRCAPPQTAPACSTRSSCWTPRGPTPSWRCRPCRSWTANLCSPSTSTRSPSPSTLCCATLVRAGGAVPHPHPDRVHHRALRVPAGVASRGLLWVPPDTPRCTLPQPRCHARWPTCCASGLSCRRTRQPAAPHTARARSTWQRRQSACLLRTRCPLRFCFRAPPLPPPPPRGSHTAMHRFH